MPRETFIACYLCGSSFILKYRWVKIKRNSDRPTSQQQVEALSLKAYDVKTTSNRRQCGVDVDVALTSIRCFADGKLNKIYIKLTCATAMCSFSLEI